MLSAATSVDVLIVGAGPAGLALANWFRNSDISVRLIDSKPGPTPRGQAEGLKSTTVEIFEAFGIGAQVWAEAWRLEEIAIWGPKSDGDGIVREIVMQDKVEELGKPRECCLQQARVEHHMLINLLASDNIAIQRSTMPTNLSINEQLLQRPDANPISVQLEKIDYQENGDSRSQSPGKIEELRAKYVVGCDGAHSWTRKQIGSVLEGDLTDSVFGVVDIVPKTNFPDIRKVCYLRAASGTILLVPRSNREVRLYIPVESGSVLCDPNDLTLERIIDAARKIISPYTLDVGKCSWWSAYRVGHRVGTHYSLHDRVFLAGDAVHTHSPKAGKSYFCTLLSSEFETEGLIDTGQGMNTSIQDAYNLGWKLRLVLEGRASPAILSTYESERRPVAQDLIAFDRGYLKLFSAPSASFESEYLRGSKFTTGMSIRYPKSILVHAPVDLGPSLLKADVVPGKRLPDFQAVYQADGTTTRIHQRLRATGSFRLLIFAGDISKHQHLARLQDVGVWLADVASGLGRLTCGGDAALVEVLVVHAAAREDVDLMTLHDTFRPWSEDFGWDYWRLFADVESAHEGHGHAYERLEISKVEGRTVIVRPDGYIGAVLDVQDTASILKYFEEFL